MANSNITDSTKLWFTIHGVTGLLVFPFNLAFFIALVGHKVLRTQNNYRILATMVFYDWLLSVGLFAAAVDRFILFWTGKENVFVSRLDCFTTPWVLLLVPCEHCFGLVYLIVSVDRLLSVFIPLQYGGFGHTYAYIMISTATIPLIVLYPYLYHLLDNPELDLISPVCITAEMYPTWYHKWITLFTASCLALGVLLYIPTVIKLRKSNQVSAQQQIREDHIALKQQRRLTVTMVVSSVVLFALVIVPSIILAAVPADLAASYAPLRACFVQVGIATNFVLFIVRHKHLKKAVKHLFKCKKLTEASIRTGL